MSSTPKQRDGDASGSHSSLEQTVMGVAPPPPSSAPVPLPPVEPASAPSSSATILAAPTIPVTTPLAAPQRAGPEEAPLASVSEPARSEAGVGETLRIEPMAPPVVVSTAPAGPPHLEPAPQISRDQTALSADYLRAARAAALDEVSQGAPHDPIGLASTERAEVADVAAALASAGASIGDTHRSVAPPMEAGPASTRTGASGASGAPRGFEPVPVLRAPLAESLSSALGPLAELGGTRNLLPPTSRPHPPPLPEPPREGVGRWLVLAAVALVTVGIVSLGGRLWHRYRAHSARERAIATVHADAPGTDAPRPNDARSASHALLANRPAPESSDEGRVRVVSATAGAAKPAAGGPSASASPESQLAATAARHVLSGNYAEALPVYRQLERNWPENTSYAAMLRLLEKKVGSRNDTRTVAPATPAAHPAEP